MDYRLIAERDGYALIQRGKEQYAVVNGLDKDKGNGITPAPIMRLENIRGCQEKKHGSKPLMISGLEQAGITA